MPKRAILICSPDEPQFGRLPASIRSIADCGHPVTISAAGVAELLTTPGLATRCMRCIPGGAKQIYVPEGIRDELTSVIGKEAADNLIRLVTGGGPGA